MPKFRFPLFRKSRDLPPAVRQESEERRENPIEEVTRETVEEALIIKQRLGATIDPWERLDRPGI